MCEFYTDYINRDIRNLFDSVKGYMTSKPAEDSIFLTTNTERKSNMNPDKKNNMVINNNNICNWYEGKLYYVMPDIVDVNVIKNDSVNAKTVIRVFFSDGTEEKAVLAHGDIFCLETGIGICIAKKVLSMRAKNGNSLYNKIVHRATKIMRKNQEKIAKVEREQLDAEVRYQKLVEKKKRRNDRKRQQEIEDVAQFFAEVERRKNEILNTNK